MEADDLLCSRNARPQKALVGRAQGKINQPPSLKRKRASLEGSFIRAVEGSLAAPSKRRKRKTDVRLTSPALAHTRMDQTNTKKVEYPCLVTRIPYATSSELTP